MGMGAEFWIGLLVVVAVILVLSLIGDLVLEHGSFWLFLLITIVVSGLLLAVFQVVRQLAGG
jgi:hypothetical protein